MLILLGLGEGIFHVLNILLLAYLIKGCDFNIDYKKIIGAGFLIVISLTMYELYDTTGMTLTINLIVEFLVFVDLVKMKIKDKIVCFFMFSFLETFLIKLVDFITNGIEVGDAYFNSVKILKVMIVFCILVTIACYMYHRARMKEQEEANLYIQVYLSLGLLLGILIFVGIGLFGEHISVKLYIALIILAILSPIINVLMYIFCIKKYVESAIYKADLKSMEVALSLQDKHFNDMVDSYSNLKIFRHDVNSYLNAISKLVDGQNYDELHLLTNDLKQAINVNISICSNVYISASINQFLGIMEKQKVEFNFEYDVFEEVDIKGMHLCSLFYNLLSNAVEAVMFCDVNKLIQLDIYTKNNALIIKIVNSVNESFAIEHLQIGKSSKEDKEKHGVGLRSIQDIVELYSGNIYREVRNNELHTEIILFEAIKDITK